MKKIYYLAYYSNSDEGRKRDAVPAADLQVSYLTEVFSDLGYEVEIISPNIPNESRHHFSVQEGFVKKVNKNVTVRYFRCIESWHRIIRMVSRRLIYFYVAKYIKQKRNEIFLIYHSRLYYPYYSLFHRLNQRYILELEEIYSDVMRNAKKRRREIREIAKASAYILPSIPLAEEIAGKKKYVLYHGSCRNEKQIGSGFGDGRIHVVYAGTFDPRVIGKLSLIQAAEYLDEKYHIHIIGFGRNQDDVNRIIDEVKKMQGKLCKVTYDGLLLGTEYIAYIQNCDIGVFAHDPEGDDVNSSFPSKIMSYLSNGLHVVSTRVDSVERSEVGYLIHFCDTNEPEDVAKAIKTVDLSAPYDSRKELKCIEEKLKKDLEILLDSYN